MTQDNNSIDPKEIDNSWRTILDWKKVEFSDLTKAKKVITDKSISLKKLQKLTKISYHTLNNNRSYPTLLDNAKGSTINKLAQAYNVLNLEKMSEDEINQIYEDIGVLFNKLDSMSDLTNEQRIILSLALNYLTVEHRAEATYKIKQCLDTLEQTKRLLKPNSKNTDNYVMQTNRGKER